MDMLDEDILKYTKIKNTKNVNIKNKDGVDVGMVRFETKFKLNVI